MNDEFIIFDDDNNNSYQESYEPDDDVTLEDVESYLESMRNDITDAMELHDDMIQEGYEYEDLSLEDVESYIESNIDNYNNGVDLYNTMIQESDDNLTDDFEESARRDISPYDRAHRYREDPRETLKRHEVLDRNSIDPTGRYYEIKADKEHIKEDDELRSKRHKNKIYKDNIDKLPSRKYIKAKELRDFYTDLDKNSYHSSGPDMSSYHKDSINIFNNDMKDIVDAHKARKEADKYSKMTPMARAIHKKYEKFDEYALTDYRDNEVDLELDEPLTAYEFFDESYEPDDTPIIPRSTEEIEFAQEVTLVELGIISAAALAAIKVGHKLIDQLIVHRKFGRFPKDMKRLYDILESENFKASENKRSLKKALRALSKDLVWMLSPGMYSRWKITPNEKTALKKLQKHVNDLYLNKFMLTRSESLSNKRRIPERLDELVQQGNKVLEILNKTIYKKSPDVTTEWMV